MPYDKSNKQIQDSAFKMKAYKTGPMQKNFGKNLAINKKLDKDSMSGGLTGQPGEKLNGPLQKKKGGFKPSNIGAKLKAKYKGTKQTTNRAGKKIGGTGTQAERSARVNAPKKRKSNVPNPTPGSELTLKTKNNLTLGGGSTPKMGNAGDVNRKGTGKYKDNTYTRSGKTGSTSVVTKGGKRIKTTGDIKDYTKKGGNTKIKVKAKNKSGSYSSAKSVNALVKQRDKFNTNPKNKGKKYPGQAEINKRLKKNPKKFD